MNLTIIRRQLNESEKRPSDESVHEYFEEDALRSGKGMCAPPLF